MPYNPKYSQRNEERRREKSHRVTVDFDKDFFADVLKASADAAGLTVNGYIKKAIAEKIERDASRG